MSNLRFKLSSDSAAVNGTEFNLRASDLIAFTPAFYPPATEGAEPAPRTDATIVIYSAGQVTVQESCRTIRSMLKKAADNSAEEAAE